MVLRYFLERLARMVAVVGGCVEGNLGEVGC